MWWIGPIIKYFKVPKLFHQDYSSFKVCPYLFEGFIILFLTKSSCAWFGKSVVFVYAVIGHYQEKDSLYKINKSINKCNIQLGRPLPLCVKHAVLLTYLLLHFRNQGLSLFIRVCFSNLTKAYSSCWWTERLL